MDIKDRILEILELNRGKPVSGESLASELGVSRSAVWKSIGQLRNEGADISAATNKGYMLAEDCDKLSPQGINAILGENPYSITVKKSVTSTNTVLKELARQGAEENTVLIAEAQTEGKGRLGRRFESPSGNGLYMSVLLRPKLKAESSLFITAAAAVAVARAVEKLNVKQGSAKIKWVNDIFLNDRKICGILTEASLDLESGGLEYAVLGIGVNISPSEVLTEKLDGIAGWVFDKPVSNSRNRLAAEILRELSVRLADPLCKETIDEYRSRSFLDGKEIIVIRGNDNYRAVAVGIDENARLIIKTPDGELKALSSGEVSVRQLQDLPQE